MNVQPVQLVHFDLTPHPVLPADRADSGTNLRFCGFNQSVGNGEETL